VYAVDAITGEGYIIDSLSMAVIDTFYSHNMQSLLAAFGFNTQQLSGMLNNVLGNSGMGSVAGSFLSLLFGGTTGNTNNNNIASLFSSILTMMMNQMGMGTSGGLPLMGDFDIKVGPAGRYLYVTNMVWQDISQVEIATKNIAVVSNPNAGTMPGMGLFSGPNGVDVHQ
jgi:hypothetical protein